MKPVTILIRMNIKAIIFFSIQHFTSKVKKKQQLKTSLNKFERFSSESAIQADQHYLANNMDMQRLNQNDIHQTKNYSKTASFMSNLRLNDNQHFVQQYFLKFFIQRRCGLL